MRIVDGKRSALELAQEVRPRVHPDRPRLPRRPLLQPRRLPGAGAVHLPALRPLRRRLELLRHRRLGDRLRPRRRHGHLVRAVRRDRRRPRDRARARPRPGAGALEGPADAACSQVWMLVDDGLLQRPRPLPALAGERLTWRVPVAHAGHWLPYVIPASIVLIAVVVSLGPGAPPRADAGEQCGARRPEDPRTDPSDWRSGRRRR